MNRSDKAWLEKQTFFITGGAGILGQGLVQELTERGAKRIVVFDRRGGTGTSHSHLVQGRDIHYVSGDILNESEVNHALSGCTVLFHLAALKHAGHSTVDPSMYMEVNGLGTCRVLEACQRQGIRHAIYTSTCHVYGKPRYMPVDEEHCTSPLSLYAASKLAGEAAMQVFATQFGMSTVNARLSNIYGPFMGADTVIGRIIEQVAAGNPIRVRNMTAIRDFIYVDDAIEALILLLLSSRDVRESMTVNVSTGIGISISEVVRAAVSAMQEIGLRCPGISSEDYSEEIPELVIDNSLLRKTTKWEPGTGIKEGLICSLRQRLKTERESYGCKQKKDRCI